MEQKEYFQDQFRQTITTIDIRDVKLWVANERWRILEVEYLGDYQIRVTLGRKERVYYQDTGEDLKIVRREVID